MSWTCKLLGHKYEEKYTERREKEGESNTAVFDVEVRECKRCDQTKEEKLRTKIRNEDNQEQEESTERSYETESQSTGTTGSFSSSSGNAPRANQAQGGVILKDKTEEDTEEESGLDENHEYREDEGVVMYDRNDQDVSSIIRCESCDFSRRSSETSRRSGDMCVECGGWLEVERMSNEDEEGESDEENTSENTQGTESEKEDIEQHTEIL